MISIAQVKGWHVNLWKLSQFKVIKWTKGQYEMINPDPDLKIKYRN